MNEKIVGWIAIAVILGTVGWIHKCEPLSPRQLQIAVIIVLGLGILLLAVSLREARRTVVKRRRMYKGFWRQCERGDTTLDLPQEEAVVLLGRIKGGRLTTVVMIAGTAGALYYEENLFGLVLALGQAFLAARLHLMARSLDRALAPDSARDIPDIRFADGHASEYVLDINIEAVHNFIAPRAALPFWTVADTEKWLIECGFRRTNDGRWRCQRDALRLLEADEIRSIEPSSRG